MKKTFIRLDNMEEIHAYSWDLLYGPPVSSEIVSTRHLIKILGKRAIDESVKKGHVPYLAISAKWAVRLVDTTTVEARAAQVAYLLLRDRDDTGQVECLYCQSILDIDHGRFEVEHILNRAHGGPSHASNMALVCPECNRLMGSMSIVEKVKMAINRRRKWENNLKGRERSYATSYLDHLIDGTEEPTAIKYGLSPIRASKIRENIDKRWNQILETVEEGEDLSDVFQVYPTIVKPACENKHNGRWYCVNHRTIFDTQIAKDCHIQHGKHRMLWLCFEHGPEKP